MEVYWCVLQPTKDRISSNVSSLKSGRLQCYIATVYALVSSCNVKSTRAVGIKVTKH